MLVSCGLFLLFLKAVKAADSIINIRLGKQDHMLLFVFESFLDDKNVVHGGEYERAAVASEHQQCSQIGKQILIDQGNAVDSAIATLLCIGVINNFSSGIGG
jgi:hypothetical protein